MMFLKMEKKQDIELNIDKKQNYSHIETGENKKILNVGGYCNLFQIWVVKALFEKQTD